MTGLGKDRLWRCCQNVCVFQDRLYHPLFFESAIEKFFLSLEEKKRSNNWRWKYWILACRLKAVEVLIWLWMLGGNVKWNLREFMVVKRMHRERSQLCHLKEEKKKKISINGWLCLRWDTRAAYGWLGDAGALVENRGEREWWSTSLTPFRRKNTPVNS